MSAAQDTLDAVRSRYRALRVGQAIYVSHPRSSSARVVGVGRKYIRLAGGVKIEGRDVIDWWYG